ncbi:MAG: hypothetical protein WC967_14420 [Balneolaceae bacterium]
MAERMDFFWKLNQHFILFRHYGTLFLNTGVVLFVLAATVSVFYKTPELSELINYPFVVFLTVNFMLTGMVSNLFCGGYAERKNYSLCGIQNMDQVIITKNFSLIVFFLLISVLLLAAGHLIVHPSAEDYRQAVMYELCILAFLPVIGTFSSVYLIKNTEPGVFEMMVVGFCFIIAHIPYLIVGRLLNHIWLCLLIFIVTVAYWYIIQVPKAATELIRKNFNLPVQ